MTDRVDRITVVLEHDTRTDDVEALVAAISQLRGVLTVKANVRDPGAMYVAEARVRADLRKRIWDALERDPKS